MSSDEEIKTGIDAGEPLVEQPADADEQTEREQQEQVEREALKNAIREQAREDENPLSTSFTLRRILGGDFLTAAAVHRYIGVILLVLLFIVIYIANRYSCEKDLIEIDALKKELQDAKYKALSSSSELTEQCRESNILKMLQAGPDSMLQTADQPPYIITIPKK